MRKLVTKKKALETIKSLKEKDLTSYYGYTNCLSGGTEYLVYSEMVEMFIDLGFGGPESEFIVASMVVAGAKFTR